MRTLNSVHVQAQSGYVMNSAVFYETYGTVLWSRGKSFNDCSLASSLPCSFPSLPPSSLPFAPPTPSSPNQGSSGTWKFASFRISAPNSQKKIRGLLGGYKHPRNAKKSLMWSQELFCGCFGGFQEALVVKIQKTL